MMKRFTKQLITAFTLALLSLPALARAVTLRVEESEITPPVGGDILPGGSLGGEDIKASIIFSRIIPFIIQYAIGLAVALSVIALIIGGYQFMTAYGDTNKHETAQKTITYALVGLVISITAYGIVYIITSIRLT